MARKKYANNKSQQQPTRRKRIHLKNATREYFLVNNFYFFHVISQEMPLLHFTFHLHAYVFGGNEGKIRRGKKCHERYSMLMSGSINT